MFNTRITPPPLLHSTSLSDRESNTSRETTPATPITVSTSPDKSSATRPADAPWIRRQLVPAKATTSLCLDSSLINPDFDENTFPQFGASPGDSSMALVAPPDANIAIRQTSTSPRGNQPSGLTAAFKRSDSGENSFPGNNSMDAQSMRPPSLAVPETSDMSRFENGARPISMKGRAMDRNRRESLAQSLGMGMSWGGASVGSWIRDE